MVGSPYLYQQKSSGKKVIRTGGLRKGGEGQAGPVSPWLTPGTRLVALLALLTPEGGWVLKKMLRTQLVPDCQADGGGNRTPAPKLETRRHIPTGRIYSIVTGLTYT